MGQTPPRLLRSCLEPLSALPICPFSLGSRMDVNDPLSHVFALHEYTEFRKWMSGWQTRGKRIPGKMMMTLFIHACEV